MNNIVLMLIALIEESISERKSKTFEKGLNAKVKFYLYKTFGKGVCMEWLMLGPDCYLSSGQVQGRHRSRKGSKVNSNEHKSVSHVLWECPTFIYSSSRTEFL